MAIKEIELQQVVAGMDIGKRLDYSVITILEKYQQFEYRDLGGGKHAIGKPFYNVADQHRLALDTPHTAQVDYVTRLMNNTHLLYNKAPTLIVDASGIGESHFDSFIERGLNVYGVVSTAGGKVNLSKRRYTVPRDDITGALILVMENRRLKIPDDLPFKDVLIKELTTFTWKQQGSGFKAEHESGGHDDTVIALAYPLWWCERNQGRRIKSFPKKELGIR